MKSQLIEKLKNLLEVHDVSTNKQEIQDIKAAFKIAIAHDKKIQIEAWNELEHAEGEDLKYVASEEDHVFNTLLRTYEERIKIFEKKINEEKTKNLARKKELIAQLNTIVQNEKNIGKSFQHFNLLSEKWRTSGDIPKDQYPKINTQYQKLRERFFYNINIYKELQDYDLKVNLKRKEELITRVKALKEEKSIKECEYLLTQIQKEWYEIGPSPKETYKEIGDLFFGAIRDINIIIQKFYSGLNEEMNKNLIKRKELLNEAKILTEKEIITHPEWIKHTRELIVIQEKWKSIDYTKNKENETVWREFRKICDLFFERKEEFYAKRKEEYDNNKRKKEELIERVKQIQQNTNWDKTTEELLLVQKEWKNTGNTFQKDEQQLWHLFKEACDVFFSHKRAHFQRQETEQKQNMDRKIKLIKEMEIFELSEDIKENIKHLKYFSEMWKSIGSVPSKFFLSINFTFNKTLNNKFGDLIRQDNKNPFISYEQKVELLKSIPNRDYVIKKEAEILQRKMEKLRQQANQYKNNMGFFSNSSGSEILKVEVTKKVNAVETEIEEVRKQLQLL